MLARWRYVRQIEAIILTVAVTLSVAGLMMSVLFGNKADILVNKARRARLISVFPGTGPLNLFPAEIVNGIVSAHPLVAFSLAKVDEKPAPSAPPVSKPVPMPPSGAPSIPISASGPFSVQDAKGVPAVSVAAGQQVNITYFNGNYFLFGPDGFIKASNSEFRAVPLGDSVINLPGYTDWNWNKTLNLNSFRGIIEVRYSPVSKVLWAINDLPMEDYLKGVSEASADAPAEHLKVMAIVERSYAWHHVNNGNRHPGEPFTLKNSRNGNGDDQIYQGYLAETRLPRLVGAVAATTGEVVTYRGQSVITPYSSNPGGRTRTPQEAGWKYNWPWVKSVPDPDTVGMSRAGHGVGLSGLGSRKRAERGESAQVILGYYFPGTGIGNVPTTGKSIRIAIYSVH